MKTRTFRIAILTAMSAMLIFPTAASAHGEGPCEHMLHDHVEPAVGPAGSTVHAVEEAACPTVDAVLGEVL